MEKTLVLAHERTVVMSAEGSPSSSVPPTDLPTLAVSASYLPCRHCGEGSLVYDEARGTSVCRCCGARDD